MVLNPAPLPYVDSVKYLRFMFTLTPWTMLIDIGRLELSMLVVTPFCVNLLNVMSLLRFLFAFVVVIIVCIYDLT